MPYSPAPVEPRIRRAPSKRNHLADWLAKQKSTKVPLKIQYQLQFRLRLRQNQAKRQQQHRQRQQGQQRQHHQLQRQHRLGISLIEMLVVISITTILASLAAPALGEFVRRSAMLGLGKDFLSALQRARAEAVNRNSCASICKSNSTSSPNPQCSADSRADSSANYGPDDWQMGWIVFLNPSCNSVTSSDPASPGYIILLRQSGDSRYRLRSSNHKSSFTFGPQGGLALSEVGQLELTDSQRSLDPLASNIVIDVMGRSRIESRSKP